MTYAIGEKYVKRLEPLLPYFESYSRKCDADFIIIDDYLDKSMKRNFWCQKMLLPSLYSSYEWIVWLDSDIIINKDTPSIFDTIVKNKGFSAVEVPHGTDWWRTLLIDEWKCPHYMTENKKDDFIMLGFKPNEKLTNYINDGVTLCNTKLTADLFGDFYYNEWDVNGLGCINSEGAAAYVSQINDLYWLMDKKWNYQIIYPMVGSEEGKFARKNQEYYKLFVRNKLSENYLLHFAGGFRIPIVHYKDDKIKDIIYELD